VASVDENSPHTALHLHLYDPLENQFDELEKLALKYKRVQLTSTWEYTDLSSLNDEKRIIYYQSARFIRAYCVLKSLRIPIITVDIDSLIRGPVKQIVHAAGGADVGLILRTELSHPGKNVLASTVFAVPTGLGLDFFESVVKRIAVHLLARVQTEMLDQRCLWKSYVTHKFRARIWDISQIFSDWNLADSSLIWHGKGPRKQSEKYLREKGRLVSFDECKLVVEDADVPGMQVARTAGSKNIRVGWKPQNDEPRVASTRIRCLNPLKELQRQGYQAELYSDSQMDEYDIVVFLKAYSENDINLAVDLKQEGKIVIFDICDNHFLMNSERVTRLKRMFELADHWVTSTPALAAIIRANIDGDQKPIHIIEDAVEESLIAPVMNISSRIKARWNLDRLSRFLNSQANCASTHLVWFGTHQGSYKDSGLVHVNKLKCLLEELNIQHKLTLTVISNSREAFENIFSDWSIPAFYLDWNPYSFFRAMQLHSIAVIPIERNEFTKVKTNNRVVLSLQLGLGVVADSIDSYKEFSDCIVLDDWENGLAQYITHPEIVGEHVRLGKKIIAQHYSLPVIASAWQKMFGEIWEDRESWQENQSSVYSNAAYH